MTIGPDRSSGDAFYREHRDNAVRWSAGLVGRVDVAEELAQDALLATIARLDTLDRPVAYLRRCVVNACMSWHRSAAREQRWIDDTAALAPLGLMDRSVEVLDIVKAMPLSQRTVMILRFWADWPDADIAAALDTTQGNVRVLAHRGLASLKGTLARAEEVSTDER